MLCNLTSSDLDDYVYRIISLDRLEELFSTKKNILAKPASWKDTFENFILKSEVKLKSGEIVKYNLHERIYGQCWTLHKASDAMWRIYSLDGQNVRIRSTVGVLLSSLYSAHPEFPEARCCVGKVEYLGDKKLMEFANNIFDDSGISVENIFKSLLVKRTAFVHEKEVRIVYDGWAEDFTANKLHSYKIDPQSLVSQIMIDPRSSYSEFLKIKRRIISATGYEGDIKKSLLYALPKKIVLNVTNGLKG